MHNTPAKRQAFSEHLQELRSRILVSVVALVIGTISGYLLHQTILDFLIRPLHQPVFYSSPSGGFDFILKISLFFGFLVALPVFTYQLLRFIAPALPYQSPKRLMMLLVASCVLLVTGMCFAYLVSLPAALFFLNTFATGQIKALITTDEYLSFVTRYLLGFGLLFQLPLIMLTINSVQRIPARKLMGFQRWVIVLSFLVAAILTPTPDVFNQALMAVPQILLYEFTVAVLLLVNRKHHVTPD
ncbi:MAG: twin-arginine translocase subunit TatC [Chloroflexota bacterium]